MRPEFEVHVQLRMNEKLGEVAPYAVGVRLTGQPLIELYLGGTLLIGGDRTALDDLPKTFADGTIISTGTFSHHLSTLLTIEHTVSLCAQESGLAVLFKHLRLSDRLLSSYSMSLLFSRCRCDDQGTYS